MCSEGGDVGFIAGQHGSVWFGRRNNQCINGRPSFRSTTKLSCTSSDFDAYHFVFHDRLEESVRVRIFSGMTL